MSNYAAYGMRVGQDHPEICTNICDNTRPSSVTVWWVSTRPGHRQDARHNMRAYTSQITSVFIDSSEYQHSMLAHIHIDQHTEQQEPCQFSAGSPIDIRFNPHMQYLFQKSDSSSPPPPPPHRINTKDIGHAKMAITAKKASAAEKD
jgi:hypothetical protein